jgi:hypothetical protein
MSHLVPVGGSQVAHVALSYGTTDQFLNGVLAFVGEGLAAGQPVLLAMPEPKIGLLRERLKGRDHGLSWADMAQIGINPAWIIPRMHAFVSAHAGQPVRCVQELAWGNAYSR